MDATLLDVLNTVYGKWIALVVIIFFVFKDQIISGINLLLKRKTRVEKKIDTIVDEFKSSKNEIYSAYNNIQKNFDDLNDRMNNVEKKCEEQENLPECIKVVMKESLISKMNRLIAKKEIDDEESEEIYHDLKPYLELNGNGSVQRKFLELQYKHPDKFGQNPWDEK